MGVAPIVTRRCLLAGALATVAARVAAAQPATRMPRIGYLAASLGPGAAHLIAAFRDGLREAAR